MTSTLPTSPEGAVLFRPGKKRKMYRHRSEDGESLPPVASSTETSDSKPTELAAATTSGSDPKSATEVRRAHNSGSADNEEDEQELAVAEVLRRRNARNKSRLGGVAFRAGPNSRAGDDGTAERANTDLTLANSADKILGGITGRFASQTGLVGELVNKHMEEYVESELARRQRHAAENAAALALAQSPHGPDNSQQTTPQSTEPETPMVTQRALRGKIVEIDLGDEAREHNVALTERARRRLAGQIAEEEREEEQAAAFAKKSRLDADEKPERPRDRRGSDDVKRDQLVEEFLRENKLDVYDISATQAPEPTDEDEEEGAADDRIADKFRREFMEAIAARRRRKRPVNSYHKKNTKPRDDILRGPKLGGSRNVRSAMRDILLKEQEEKKKGTR